MTFIDKVENTLAQVFSNIKFVEKALLGLEGSYVELLTILSLGFLAILPVIIPEKNRQRYRHINQIAGVIVFIFVVFTCLGVFGMIRNFIRGLDEIGRENIVALYYLSVPATILVTSLLFGPAFCGWICPTGALQEFVGKITRPFTDRWKKRGYGRSWVVAGAAVVILSVFFLWMYRLSVTRIFFLEDASIYWSEILALLVLLLAFRMSRWDKNLRKLRIVSFAVVLISAFASIKITSPVHFGFAKVHDPASFLSTVMVILAALVIPRIWCRYLCPWRFMISWAGKKSIRKIKFDKTNCTECRKCNMICEVDAVDRGNIDMNECHFCMKCVDNCPEKCFVIKDEWNRT